MSENKSVEPVASNITTLKPSASLTNSQAVSLCAAGLLGCFFLPWAMWFGGQISGFDLQKTDEAQKLLWAIPVFCLITIVGGLTGRSQRSAAQITGVLPFIVLGYWLHKAGTDVLHTLSYGAYLSLILGLVLIVLPRRMK